jgi:hypothetical protein
LDLIPEDAVAVAVRDLKDLTRKGDKLAADTGVNFLPRPSRLFAEVVRGLGITKGLDETGPAFVMLANPAKAGVKLGPNGEPQLGDLQQLVVAAFSFTDRDQIAANFGIKKGELKPDSIVRGKAPAGNPWNLGLYFCAHGKQLFLGDNEKAVASAVKGRSAAAALGEARRRALRDTDVLVHLPIKPWHGVWENFIVLAFESNLCDRGDAGDQRTARQLIGALRSVRAVLIAVRVDGGLGIRFVNIFPRDVNQSTRDFLASLNGGAGGATLAGLPDGPVLAAQAMRGNGEENAAVVRLFINGLAGRAVPARLFFSSFAQVDFAGVFTEVWQHLQGSRVAVYRNADPTKLGLFSGLAVLDTEDAARFLKDMKQLVRFAATTAEDLSGPKAREEDVAAVGQLIRDLGDRKFCVRLSATTKLRLLGEPVLPYLEKALKSDDPEVVRRATAIKEKIVQAAEQRRKELLSKGTPHPLRPSFAFAARSENRDGQRIEVLRVKLSGGDSAVGRQLQELFGPRWDQVRLAARGKQVVVLVGSDRSLLGKVVKDLQGGRGGLATSAALGPFARHSDLAHQFEFHVSLHALEVLAAAEDLRKGAKVIRGTELSSFALTAEADRLQLDVWLPVPEIKVLAKVFGL